MYKYEDLDLNKIYTSPGNGNYIVTGQAPSRITPRKDRPNHPKVNDYAYIRFIDTGFETTAWVLSIVQGRIIKDNLLPSIANVGCLGYTSVHPGNRKIYDAWHDMLHRCYNSEHPSYPTYGGRGVTVCERWKRFDYFEQDAKNLPGYDKMLSNPYKRYSIDKDELQQGIPIDQKIYSPETCMWMSLDDNVHRSILDNMNNAKLYPIGVTLTHGNTYNVRVRCHDLNNNKRNFGNYDDIKYAAAMANFAIGFYGSGVTTPGIEPIDPWECLQHRVRPLNYEPKQICHIVKRQMYHLVNKE